MHKRTTLSLNLRPILVRALGRFTGVLVITALLCASGCTGVSTFKNMLTGKVTHNGQVVSGELIFIGSDGKELPTLIKPTGEYEVLEPPTGNAKILVRSMVALSGGVGLKAPPGSGTANSGVVSGPAGGGGVEPPKKFGDIKKPLITVEVKGGKQTFDIELEKF